ncbi:MAG: phosphate signaling complex protein PhoU [Oscillospiraceae bacterium]
MRSRFDKQLALLNTEMIEMGAMCEEAIALASKALTTGDVSLAKNVVPISSDIDRKERDIETRCLRLLLQQQPVAKDLRQISAALKMITDMERIGDQAEDIAEIITYLEGRTAEDTIHIRDMAAETIVMVTDSVDAYVKRDIELAKSVIAHDDKVDDFFDRIKRSLIKMVTENPENGEFALDLLMIAKYFERIGDHAVNIAEWVIFSVTGEHKHNP